ncbi:glycoside-pentoside-hexuronide (GPH):cation symporter [Vibrio tritonius]|uniref:glycoside-pentoside-hexuronide (GPH):cation symporter n=1 Tax=Vibrio tritonius TaxID=1435069 RepID=UPI000838EE70|nr:glycoside-pentoside-hexuronide (GPH):cation symporter [Vibrio tritonius]
MKMNVLSKTEKIGYGLGDAASHIIFDNIMMYMMFFYTDVFGLNAAFVGTMFLGARVLDAISDPAMGLVSDRTKSRWGKFRPYLLFAPVPFAVSCVLTYTVPDLSMMAKMFYASATYILMTLMYTIVNIPYCALGGVITAEPEQRISLQSYRFVISTAGGMISTVLMLPLVKWIGGDDQVWGYQGAIIVLSVVATILFFICFATTHERIETKADSEPGTARQDLVDILRNDQWRVVGVLTILNIMAVAIRGGSMMYYVTYILGRPEIFAYFLATYSVGNMFGSALAKPLTKNYCKVYVFFWTNILLAVVSSLMFFVPMSAMTIMFIFILVIGILHQLVTPIQWVMMSDTVDYGEWKYGKRLTGVSFAGTLFVLKLGLALAGAVIGWLLAYTGYQSGAAVQNSTAATSIVILFTLLPAICYLVSGFVVSKYYVLTDAKLMTIMSELEMGSKNKPTDFVAQPPVDHDVMIEGK